MTHAEAREILRSAFARAHGRGPSSRELAYSQAVAWLENRYGRAGQFAAMADRGDYNWGSLHARGSPPNCPAGSAPGSDVGSVCFQVYPTDEAAAAAFLRVLTVQRPAVLRAMNGSSADVARAMKASGYYEAPEATYARALDSAVRATGGSIAGGSSSGLILASLALLGGGAYYGYRQGWFRNVKLV